MMKRLKNKEPIIRPRKDRPGLFEVDYIDADGVRKRLTKPTIEEAQLLKADLMRARILEPTQSSDALYRTVGEQAQQFLYALPYRGLQYKTIKGYRELTHRYITEKPVRDLKLKDFSVGYAHKFLIALSRDGHAKNTICQIKTVFSLILDEAVLDNVLDSNPFRNLPRKKGPSSLTKADRLKNIRPLTREYLYRYYDTIHDMQNTGLIGSTYAMLLTLYPRTGLRPSEGLGLQPGDIDFVGKTLRVCRTIEENGSVKDETKTGEERKVDLSDETLTFLEGYVTWLQAEAVARGADEVTWLFPNEVGRPLDLAKVRKLFHKVLTRAGIERHRLYDLRHTFASLLLNQGAHITYVSHQLGHAKADTTLRCYAKWMPDGTTSFAHLLDAPPAQHSATSSATNPNYEGVAASQVVDFNWSRRVGLNHRPTVYETVALPLSYAGSRKEVLCKRRVYAIKTRRHHISCGNHCQPAPVFHSQATPPPLVSLYQHYIPLLKSFQRTYFDLYQAPLV